MPDIGPRARARSCCYPAPWDGSRIGFFDGAEQKCFRGDEMVIKLQLNHTFLLRMGVGKDTNTKAKILFL